MFDRKALTPVLVGTVAAVVDQLPFVLRRLFGPTGTPTLGGLATTTFGLLAVGVVFGYALRLGRKGINDTPRSIAGRFLVAGLAAGSLSVAIQVADLAATGVLAEAGAIPVGGFLATTLVRIAAPLSLAGVAGVALGACRGPTPGTAAAETTDAVEPDAASDDPRIVALTLAVAVVAGAFYSVLLVPAKLLRPWLEPGWWLVGAEWASFRMAMGWLTLYGVAIGLAYRLGSRGVRGSPTAVARLFALAGLVAAVVVTVLTGPPLSAGLGWHLTPALEVVVGFVLAGLAGVPMGRLSVVRRPPDVDDGDDEVVRPADS